MITKPKLHSLAVSWTCHQIHKETEVLWLGHVLFNFVDPLALLDKLPGLPPSSIPQIRHLRAENGPFRAPGCFDSGLINTCFLDLALHIFSGLRPESLIIFEESYLTSDYNISKMIQSGDGWENLHVAFLVMCLFANSKGVSHQFKDFENDIADWHRLLHDRDGNDLQASASLSYSTNPRGRGALLDFLNRRRLDTPLPFYEQLVVRACGVLPSGLDFYNIDREMIVTVEQGKGVDVTIPNNPSYDFDEVLVDTLHDTLRLKSVTMTLRDRLRHIVFNEDGDIGCRQPSVALPLGAFEETSVVVRDGYDDVDEHRWLFEV